MQLRYESLAPLLFIAVSLMIMAPACHPGTPPGALVSEAAPHAGP